MALLKPIRLGLDVYGKDFDHIKFKLAAVKFKDSNTVIGKGGVLIRQEDVNFRSILHKNVVESILRKNEWGLYHPAGVNLNCRQVSEEQSDGDACVKRPPHGHAR